MSGSILDFLNSWAPMLLLVIVWILFMWSYRRNGGYGTQYHRDHMEEMRKQSEALARIATALERRTS